MNVPGLATTQIQEICRRYRIRELAVSGSTSGAEARPDSGVDLYVEFEPGYDPGPRWFDLEEEMEKSSAGRWTSAAKSLLNPRVRREAERDAVILYAE